MRAKRLLTPVLCLLVLSGCASDDETYEIEDPGDMLDDVMPCPSEVPDTEVGMTIDGAGATLRAELIEADDLPATKGLNHWVVRFTDIAGEALDDLELESRDVMGKMAGHTHGLNHDPVIESLGDGTFDISEINLFMDGRWSLTFSPTSESLGSDAMTFDLCTAASITAAESEP
jgi:hypothetical protein